MTSKYQQIVEDIRAQITSGQLATSDKLPSIRQLSKQYACNTDTVQRALMELRHQHLIYPIAKSGYYVLETPETKTDLPLPESDIANLAYDDFRLCLNESLIGRETYLFNYYHKQEGLEELLHEVQKLLIASDVYSKIDQLVITTGTQQALYILSQMTFPNGRAEILLEEPTYPRMIELVKHLKLPYQTIKRDWEGINLKKLEQLFQSGNIKWFYTMPRLHNPLGHSYSSSEKKAIVSLAQRYDVYLIEDDYLVDFDSKHQAPLHYFDTNQHVIYIKSFSAAIFPGLRLATVVLPPLLLKEFLAHKQVMDYDTNLILQKALALYIKNGMFSKNVASLKRQFLANQAQNQKILETNHFPLPYQLLNQQVIVKLPRDFLTKPFLKQLEMLDRLLANQLSHRPNPEFIRLKDRTDLDHFLALLESHAPFKPESQ
ncbi:DNA-binding transcriptional MocR family regulator [Streptococcus rupicaprae]|uniref:DNA-binding transcriptional MocR family regulator n=1 Tax=Streptococcus rupicaprae TaxID=759619 RepID=A0ABV2FFF0_9STRE